MKKTLRLSRWLALGFVILGVAGCPQATAPEADLNLVAGDDGGSFALTTGQWMRILLPANPTTAYWWYIAEVDESVLEPTGDQYITSDPSGELLGAGGDLYLYFNARGPGTTNVRLIEAVGSDDPEPLDVYEVTVTVSAAGS